MTIKATLSRDQYIRLSILRHIQRRIFYFYAATGAALSAYAIVRGPLILILIAWIPFVLYVVPGVIGAFGVDQDHPLFQPTTYQFEEKGVTIQTPDHTSQLEWSYFSHWKVMAQCYVLFLTAGSVVALPQKAVRPVQKTKFENLLNEQIK